jgi:hypothetical protein
MKKIVIIISILTCSLNDFAQDDLLSLVDEKQPSKKVYATFKTYKLGNGQSVETVKKKNLDYRIAHRFGNLYNSAVNDALNTAAHSAFGFDAASDIRNSLDYGILDNLTVGIGRSRFHEMVDGSVKWRFLTQTTDFKIPVSIAFYGDMGYTTMATSQIYSGITKDFPTKESHRINYFSQLIIASKITPWLSLQVTPSFLHRNYIQQRINTSNGIEDQNDLFLLGFGGRIKLTKRLCLIGDFYYNFNGFYRNNSAAYNALMFGFEMETGGHVFSLQFTNATALLENSFISNTTDSWSKSQIKFGFCISRTFTL